MGSLAEQHVLNWRNRSWALTALIQVPDSGANGVLLNLGGHAGGWSFYLKEGRPSFCYNLFGLEETIVRADDGVPTGDYPPGDTAFTGTIKLIELEAGDDSHDHLIDPAQFLHFVMAKQ